MEKLIFEMSAKGYENIFLPEENLNIEFNIDKNLLKAETLDLPEVGELDIIRHYTRLSQLNYSIDTNFYPLGSCTMKYNPKINEEISAYSEFKDLHPYMPEHSVQGILKVMYDLQNYLIDISGLSAVTLLPSAGAHGELAGNFIMAKYFKVKGEEQRKIMLIPDSAHGTNPASTVMAGFKPVQITSDENGYIDIEQLKPYLNDELAGIMITQPNTLGIFDPNFHIIAKMIHEAGGLVYMDGANMNAMLGHVKPGDIGADVMHFNLHKTFSTPHGMGGPGSGPVAVRDFLVEFLPIPIVEKRGENYKLNYDIKHTIGNIKEGYGNIGVIIRALVYFLSLGQVGLKETTDIAVLNAAYMKAKLTKKYHIKYKTLTKHEFVLDNKYQEEKGIRTLDIAKRLLDYGYHAPTIYFPLIVHEAIMIEPTESESKKTIDEFIDIMLKIADEAETDPELVKTAPHNLHFKRFDETRAAKQPILRWKK
ncbi:aminomethyl-transferring glycine dehydrogenase subunit GcvPB [bacterium]|nr:aminomethyl-transferring glycine dehydrogenase subunit GcvPB [bacterium]